MEAIDSVYNDMLKEIEKYKKHHPGDSCKIDIRQGAYDKLTDEQKDHLNSICTLRIYPDDVYRYINGQGGNPAVFLARMFGIDMEEAE